MKDNHITSDALIIVIMLVLACAIFSRRHVDKINTVKREGVSVQYQVLGRKSGKPVILLHGNGGRHEDLSVMAAQLDSAGYLVFAMDSRGQGANEPLPEYHYIDMAEDVFALVEKEKLKAPAVFGWSDGGIIALQTEVLHPGTFSMICTSGANIFPECVENFEEFWQQYDSLGNPVQLPPLTYMMTVEPQMTAGDMQTIGCPALIVAGEHDLILEEHTRLIADNIPQGELLILPGEDHGSHIWKNPKMGNILIEWLRKNKY